MSTDLLIRLGGRGGTTVVDADIDPSLLQYRWRPDRDGYPVTSHISGSVFLHRRIIRAERGQIVDHIDRDPLNNRRRNLRIVSMAENNTNRSAKKFGTSRFRGLCWVGKIRQWQVYVGPVYVGIFKDEIDAALAWLAVAERNLGKINVANDRKAIENAIALAGRDSLLLSQSGRAPIAGA